MQTVDNEQDSDIVIMLSSVTPVPQTDVHQAEGSKRGFTHSLTVRRDGSCSLFPPRPTAQSSF